MEHSFIGDLQVSIVCPNGQSVVLYQQQGGWNSLGEPIDVTFPSASDPPGIPYTYCWSDNAILGTWADCGAAGSTPNLLTLSSGIQTLIPDTYSSLNPLSGLLGCPLNGEWTLQFCDNWGADDGWVFDWMIDFDSLLYNLSTSFEPTFGAGCDSTYWFANNINSSSIITNSAIDCNSICITPDSAGTYSYSYIAIDDFGCTSLKTTEVYVRPGVDLDLGPNQIFCPNTATQLNGIVIGSNSNCSYNYTINLFDSFGDGWNGAYINIYVDGNLYTTLTFNNFSSATFNLNFINGSIIDIEYFPGSWESEVSYEILDCDGNLVFSDGPNPSTGFVFSNN